MNPLTDQHQIAKAVLISRFFNNGEGSNIVGVGIGFKVTGGVVRADIKCIRVYVSRKPSLTAMAVASQIPPEIMGIPTDVVKVGRPFSPASFFQATPPAIDH